MNLMFSEEISNFNCSTPIGKYRRKILCEINNRSDDLFKKEISRLNHTAVQNTEAKSDSNHLKNVSKRSSYTASIENPRKLDFSRSARYDSSNAHDSSLKQRRADLLIRQDKIKNNEVEESEWTTTSSSIINDEDKFNYIKILEELSTKAKERSKERTPDFELHSYKSLKDSNYFRKIHNLQEPLGLTTVYDKVDNWLYDNNYDDVEPATSRPYCPEHSYNYCDSQNLDDYIIEDEYIDEDDYIDDDDYLVRDENLVKYKYTPPLQIPRHSSKKEEIIRAYRTRKVIIDDEDQMMEDSRRTNKSRKEVRDPPSYFPRDNDRDNLRRNEVSRKEVSGGPSYNCIMDESSSALHEEIEGIVYYLQNNTVGNEEYHFLMTEIKMKQRQIKRRRERKMEIEQSIKEKLSALNATSSFYGEMQELMDENKILREVLKINEITDELAESDRKLFMKNLRDNERKLKEYIERSQEFVMENLVLHNDKRRLGKIIVDNSEVLAYLFQTFIKNGHL